LHADLRVAAQVAIPPILRKTASEFCALFRVLAR
jgi:hypothetical protein